MEVTAFEKQLNQLRLALNSQSDSPLDAVKEKMGVYVQWFEDHLKQSKVGVEDAEQSYVAMCTYLAVDMKNEDAREVLPMLLLFLNEFTKSVERAQAAVKRPLKANELQQKIRMKRQEARQGLMSSSK